MRIAVTGSEGQVVRSLRECAAKRGVEIVTLARPHCDLAEPSTIFPAIEASAPDIVVNAAAYTAVDNAEFEENLAMQINGASAGTIAHATENLGIPIVQLSTDYVFDGSLDRPYRENDLVGPLGAYGRSKFAGEKAVEAANPRHVIIRISWVYSPFGANFVRTMLRLGETRGSINVVADQVGCPTSALDIADAVLDVCRMLHTYPDDERLLGVFHMAGRGEASWADFAEAIFGEAMRWGRRPVEVVRISTAQYPTPATRPSNSRLDTQKLANVYGISLPQWRHSLSSVIERLLGKN
jgi:dTDP-4-dehydrorhamnose reductase